MDFLKIDKNNSQFLFPSSSSSLQPPAIFAIFLQPSSNFLQPSSKLVNPKKTQKTQKTHTKTSKQKGTVSKKMK